MLLVLPELFDSIVQTCVLPSDVSIPLLRHTDQQQRLRNIVVVEFNLFPTFLGPLQGYFPFMH